MLSFSNATSNAKWRSLQIFLCGYAGDPPRRSVAKRRDIFACPDLDREVLLIPTCRAKHFMIHRQPPPAKIIQGPSDIEKTHSTLRSPRGSLFLKSVSHSVHIEPFLLPLCFPQDARMVLVRSTELLYFSNILGVLFMISVMVLWELWPHRLAMWSLNVSIFWSFRPTKNNICVSTKGLHRSISMEKQRYPATF